MSCMCCEKGLDLDTAIGILENIEEYVTISQPPIKPKGGEVYIFVPQTIDEQDNYKCDQYRWLNSGPKEIPRKNPLVKKQYFIGKLPHGKTQAFQKHCYVLVSDHRTPHPVLIHYIGDETVMVDYPHGNSKKSTSAYFAIAPSVRRDIANRSKSTMPTAILNSFKASQSNYYVKDEGEKDQVNPVLTPRNKSQVRNIRRKQRLSNLKEEISRDDLATLHSLGAELLGFCHYIRTFSDFACIVGLNELSVEIENLMKLNDNAVVFSFVECYKVGRYFIAPFNCIHCAFVEMPTIPCYFLISETCDFFLYEKFLLSVIECIPGLDECRTAVVITNQNYNYTSALTVAFPNWTQLYDWEFLLVAARSFLRKLHVDIKDISVRVRQLKFLMRCESFEDYRIELSRLEKDWPLAFYEYYTQVLQEPIETKLGRWQLERYKLYSAQEGLLSGVNRDLQLVVKHLQELKDVSLDVILPSLYNLQLYIHATIQKGFCGLGKYSLNSPLKFLKKDLDELVLPPNIYEPAAIVRVCRVRGITMFSDSCHTNGDEENSLGQAQRIVEMGHISHSTDLRAFLVKSTTGSLHGVQLFPRESCSCSINQRCAHIMAVMLSLGMPMTYDKKGSLKVIKPPVAASSVESSPLLSPFSHDVFQASSNAIGLESNVAANKDIVTEEEQMQQHEFQEVSFPSDSLNTFVHQHIAADATAFKPQQRMVAVSSEDLESVLSATQGSEVLMVVSDDSDGNPKPILAYEVSQRAMLEYVHTQLPQSSNISSV